MKYTAWLIRLELVHYSPPRRELQTHKLQAPFYDPRGLRFTTHRRLLARVRVCNPSLVCPCLLHATRAQTNKPPLVHPELTIARPRSPSPSRSSGGPGRSTFLWRTPVTVLFGTTSADPLLATQVPFSSPHIGVSLAQAFCTALGRQAFMFADHGVAVVGCEPSRLPTTQCLGRLRPYPSVQE